MLEVLLPWFSSHELKRGRGQRLDLIRVISGIIYVLHEGCRWRALPPEFGRPHSIYTRFSRWQKLGLVSLLFENISADERTGSERSLDASHIKVHQDANVKNPEHEAIGMTRGGRNTKLHAVVDSAGHAVKLSLSAGQVNDSTRAAPMTADMQSGEELLADKAYDVDALRAEMSGRGISVCIPPKANRRHPAEFDKEKYKKRHHVENFFQRAKRCRRIGTRYEKTANMFMAFVFLFAAMDYTLHPI